jgi:hypothetical protein
MYAPQKTFAIPPVKMAEFYTTYKLENEKYPLKSEKCMQISKAIYLQGS